MIRPKIELQVGKAGKVVESDHFDLELQYEDGLITRIPNCSVDSVDSTLEWKSIMVGKMPFTTPELIRSLVLKENGEETGSKSRVVESNIRPFTRRYFTTEEAIEESKRENPLIPSEFLSTFPNNFGINLCAVKGFEVIQTDDNQYQSIRIDFIPVKKKVGIDGRENI